MKDFLSKNILFQTILNRKNVRIEKDWAKEFDIIFHFLEILGNPHLRIKNIIHITGTNGKGSTIAFLKEILIKSNYAVNVFTSPHLIKMNERFFIQNEYISDDLLEEISNRIYLKLKKANLINSITYFEASALISYIVFAERQADFNIFEVGMGGRLDATNIFQNKLCSVITSISKDHEHILGNTRELIAKEKIAIARDDESRKQAIIFTGTKSPKIIQVFNQELNKYKNNKQISDFKLFRINDDFFVKNKKINQNLQNVFTFESKKSGKISNIKTNLAGTYQFKNASLVCEIALYLKNELKYKNITNDTIKNGLLEAKWSARFQRIKFNNIKNAKIFIDGCHNEDGFKEMYNTIKVIQKQLPEIKNIIGICAFIEGKNIKDFVKYLKIFNYIICTDIPEYNDIYKKFIPQDIICSMLCLNNITSTTCHIDKIKDTLIEFDESENLIIFFGSLYFSGKIISLTK